MHSRTIGKLVLILGMSGCLVGMYDEADALRREGRGTVRHSYRPRPGGERRPHVRPPAQTPSRPSHRPSVQKHRRPQRRPPTTQHVRPQRRPRPAPHTKHRVKKHSKRRYHTPPRRHDRRHRHPYYHVHPRPHFHPHPWYGGVILSLPSGYFSFSIGGLPYYYHSGIYYRRHRDQAYVVVPAPIGATITVLPPDFVSFSVGATRYYYYYGTFYEYDGPSNRYVVVAAPIGAVVPSIPSGYMTVYVDGIKHYVVGGVYYRPVYYGSTLMYEVVPPPDSATAATLGVVPEQLYIYPNAGQSPAQQAHDGEDCHNWAVQQTGFDPRTFQGETLQRQRRLLDYNRAFAACMQGRNYTVQ